MSIAPHDDLVSLLTGDHEAVKQRFAEFETALPEFRAELFWKLMDQLIRHEAAEEAIVYPALKQLPRGDVVARARIAEEAEAEQHLARMEKLEPASHEFLGSLLDLRDAVLAHAESEETEAFPLLLTHLDNAALVHLGQKFKSAKLAAPTHPHPHIPKRPAANKLLGPIAAFVDRVRGGVTA
ncbi:MAG TPA: hemerythrin domain-containing protein [Acidimicrobiales bacterium]|jgi:hemerythrin superfamily protein|nr:hemerythrin domain-containing protein [Acidimicrobiales bacterium]